MSALYVELVDAEGVPQASSRIREPRAGIPFPPSSRLPLLLDLGGDLRVGRYLMTEWRADGRAWHVYVVQPVELAALVW